MNSMRMSALRVTGRGSRAAGAGATGTGLADDGLTKADGVFFRVGDF